MTLSELLNSDMTTLGQWLVEGLRWWTAELTGMLPASARGWFETRPSLSAEPIPGGGYRFTRDGRLVMEGPARGRQPRAVTLRLPREAALVREVPAPALPERDLKRMLALDIDRLTPFRADQVFVDVIPGTPRALVAAIRREDALAALEQARSAGLDPRALGLAGGSVREQALDFLPVMRQAHATEGPSAGRRMIWAAIGVLVLANLAAAVGRDMLELHGLQQKLDAQQPAVARVANLRKHVLAEDARRADILARRTDGEPLRMLDSVTGAVPAGAWVDRLAFDGRSVRISGYRQDQIDITAALRGAPRLTNVRNSGGEVLTRQAAGQPFDVTADLKRASGG